MLLKVLAQQQRLHNGSCFNVSAADVYDKVNAVNRSRVLASAGFRRFGNMSVAPDILRSQAFRPLYSTEFRKEP